MGHTIDELHADDLDAVLAIYAHYVLQTTATFHARVPTRAEMRALVCFNQPRYATFVIRAEGEARTIDGYVLLAQHKAREAYDGTAEVSVYLRPERIGQGLGSQALRFIESYARTQGLHVLVATLCGDNARSVALFVRHGYTQCAHYREVGRKFGQWLDVVAYQKLLA